MSNWWEEADGGSNNDGKWESSKEANWWENAASSSAAPEPHDPWAAAAGAAPAAPQAAPAAASTNWWEAGDSGKSSWDKPADPAPATDSWGGGGGGWGNSNGGGSWGGGNGAAAGPTPNGRDFWEYQKWYKEEGKLPAKEEWELEQDERTFFSQRLGTSKGIDFDRYDHVPVDVSGSKAELLPQVQTFEELYDMFGGCIPPALIENVRRCAYDKPTPVQKFAIPAGLVGRDIMCCAQTGSGKTAAFLFPVIGRMMKSHESPVGNLAQPFEGACEPDTLVMSPTRELCIQIFEEAQKFCHRTPYRCCRIYGGEKPKDQMIELARGCDVMVATPGRLTDFLGRGIVQVSSVYVLVLDEADRMLDMGFEPQIREICEQNSMPSKDKRQTMMFSATFPEPCQRMAQDFLYNYIWIGVGIVGGAVDTVTQTLEKVTPKEKYDRLFGVLDTFYAEREDKERCLVFVNAKDTAKWLDEQLYEKKIDTGALHGNLTQQERETNLGRFRRGEIDVMIATDVASRGLDIEKVGLVVNYDMPDSIDSYVHRIGRTGRIGNKGKAVSFVACDEGDYLVESADVLKELLRIMRDAGSEIPDWLEPLVDSAQGRGGSKWGGKDYRTPTGNDWSSGTGDASGNAGWDNWNKSGGNGGGW